ncbi:calcium-binding protein [Roseomonas sp. HJA6]|uniref:Calcium-binding protein n=1 Tax=Roseomonas alba TaxID=2846776 RepID=A0ABS7A5H0_9PROT|nr:calcium-binding protein [Neoroseomonas alba]MBW6397544.1 calcium-binding protein [Neoroseomonas alba]
MSDSSSTSSNTIVGFSLQNVSATSNASQYLRFNQYFVQGAVPEGTALGARIGSQTVPVQLDVTGRYEDGSIKSAIVTLAAPTIGGGATVNGTLVSLATPSATTPVATTAALAHGYDLAVNLDISGVGARQIDAAHELAAAAAGGTLEILREGPLATEVRFDVPIARALRLTFDVVTYADGSTSTKVWFRNDSAMGSAGGAIQYNSISIVENGQTKFSQGALTQQQYQTWTQDVFDGASANPTLHVRHDVDYLEQTGAILSYDLTAPTNAAPAVPSGWTNVLGLNGVATYMPMTGGRPDIGPTTGVNATWLISQDPAAAKYALAQAQAAGTIPWHYYDAPKGHYLSVGDYPSLWIDGRGAVKPSQIASSDVWTTDRAHAPDMSYVAWILTGDTYHLDMLNAQASWVIASAWNDPRQNGLGIVANQQEEVRAQAWSLRAIQEAAYANPDGSYEKAYFSRIADNNWSYLRALTTELSQDQNEIHGYIPGSYREALAIAPWQQDFFASTTALAAMQGNEDARAVLKWQANFLSGRFLSPDLNPYTGYNYSLTVYGSNGSSLDTWAQVASAARDAGNYATGPGDGYYATVAAMSNANIITVFSGGDDPTDHRVAADAMRAYGWLLASNSPDLRNEIQYQVAPRMADGSQIGVTEMRVVAPTTANTTQTFTGGNVFAYDRGVGRTTLIGTAGADVLIDASTGGGNRLEGRGGDDYLIGGKGTNVFVPGDGRDYALILGGAARFEVNSASTGQLEIQGFRPGTDIIALTGSISLAAILASARTDGYGGTLLSISDQRTIRLDGILPGQIVPGIFDLSAAHESVADGLANRLTGTAGNDVIDGLAGNDTLLGAAGADTLIGGLGNDQLDGGVGADSMVGGAGNDIYIVDNAADRVVESANGGTDEVRTGLSYTLPTEVEILRLTGAQAISGTGNGLANTLFGNAAANVLSGLDGNDVLRGAGGADTLLGGAGSDQLDGGVGADSMVGGAGNDIYIVDNAADRVVESANGGTDEVRTGLSYTLPTEVEILRLTGAQAISGTGNGLANTLFGNAAANVLSGLDGNDVLRGAGGADTLLGGAGSDQLDGGVGADSMVGGAGNDIYIVDNAADLVVETANGGIDEIRARISITLPSEVEKLRLIAGYAIDGTGNGFANTLIGNALANRLNGGGGNDVLIGAEGPDTLTGGAGQDAFRFRAPGDGGDVITDFVHGVDHLEFSRVGFGSAFALGAFDAAHLTQGSSAVGSGAQLVYSASGVLSFDADGAGGQAATVIATLTGAPQITAADIVIV